MTPAPPRLLVEVLKPSRIALLPDRQRSRALVVTVAVTLSAAAVGATVLSGSLSATSTFLLAFGAVTFAGWYGGGLGGLVATASTSVLLDLVVLTRGEFGFPLGGTLLPFVTFIGLSLLTTAFNFSLHRAARRLRDSENLARLIVHSAPMLVAAADASGRIVLFNAECERVTGYRADEVIGAPLVDTLVAPTWHSKVSAGLATTPDAELAQPHRNAWTTRDGRERLIEWRCYRLPSPAGLVTIGLGSDVTAQQQMEANLQHALDDAETARRRADAAVAARERFIATLSHELRAPVAAAIGWSELLVKKADAPDVSRIATRIASSYGVIQRLLNDVQDLSRIDAGKVSVQPRHLQLDKILTAVADASVPSAAAQGVAIRIEVAEPLQVWGDPERLHQAVSNLVTNAVKFSPKASEIVVRAHVRGDAIEVSVEDQGPGIRDGDADLVFEPFWQADTAHGGLGLGLALVREIAELHGGTARIRRARPDGGTIASLTLPRPADSPAHQSAS